MFRCHFVPWRKRNGALQNDSLLRPGPAPNLMLRVPLVYTVHIVGRTVQK